MSLTLGDFGTSYSKLKKGDSVEVIPSVEMQTGGLCVDIGTGHNAGRCSQYVVNELVALALGAQERIEEPDFTVLDVGSRDVKYVRVRDGRFHEGDWNTVCGAMAGLTIELLLDHLRLDPSELPKSDVELGVACGILGTGAVFDLIAAGTPPAEAIAALVRGVARNAYTFAKNPEKVYLSGGLCETPAFIEAFPCEVVSVGRFLLLDGLAVAHARGLSKRANR